MSDTPVAKRYICTKCGKPRAPIFRCTCAGRGGSGHSGDGDRTHESTKNDAYPAAQETPASIPTEAPLAEDMESLELALNYRALILEKLNLEKILTLITIENNLQLGIFILKLKPGLSAKDQQWAEEWLQAIHSEFDRFKQQLKNQGLNVSDFTANLLRHQLTIVIPTLTHYLAFIQQLVDKQLLPASMNTHRLAPKPTPNNIHQEKDDEEAQQKTLTYRNPFSTKCRPRGL